MDPDEQKKARKDKIEKEQHDLTQKTRATIRIYKEIKTFLQALLPRIAPAENEGKAINLKKSGFDPIFVINPK